MAYSEKVIDHYQSPRNVGAFGKSNGVKERSDIGVGIVEHRVRDVMRSRSRSTTMA